MGGLMITAKSFGWVRNTEISGVGVEGDFGDCLRVGTWGCDWVSRTSWR